MRAQKPVWAACVSFSYQTVNECSITTEGTRSMQFNSSYGPLALSSSAPLISITGSRSTVTCTDCGILAATVPGFPYSTGNMTKTNNAQVNTQSISMSACRGSQLDLSTCSQYTGDPYLRLYNAANTLVASNDNSCSKGSRIVYTVTSSYCQQFTLRMGCAGNTTCSMTVTGGIRKMKGYLTLLSYQQTGSSTSRYPAIKISNLVMKKMSMALYVSGNANITLTNCSITNVRNDNSTAIALTNMMRGYVTINSSFFSVIQGSLGSALFVNNTKVPIVISHSLFQNSSAVSGGVLYFARAVNNVLISGCTFYITSARNLGGAIYIGQYNKGITIADSYFVRNSAVNYAGAIYGLSYNQDIRIVRSVFRNSRSTRGGSFYFDSYNVRLSIEQSYFYSCVASVHGGGGYIWSYNQYVSLIGNSFVSCSASITSGRGVGVIFFSYNSYVTVSNTVFTGCVALQAGGLEFTSYHTNVLITNSSFLANNASTLGGGLEIQSYSRNITIKNSLFRKNIAGPGTSGKFGGGLFIYNYNTDMLVYNNLFDGNLAGNGGAGLFINDHNRNCIVNNCTFMNSRASLGTGVGIGPSNYNITISNSLFTNLLAAGYGAAVYVGNGAQGIRLLGLTILNSIAGYAPGIMVNANVTNILIDKLYMNNNQGSYGGGGIILYSNIRNVLVRDSQFIKCTCPMNSSKPSTYGGAVAMLSSVSRVVFDNVYFGQCSASQGGCIYIGSNNKHILFNNITIKSTTALYYSCGISFVSNNTNITVSNSIFTDGTLLKTTYGGALYFQSNNTRVSIFNCYFRNFSSSAVGFYSSNYYLAITNNVYYKCNAKGGSGGAVYMNSDHKFVTIANNKFLYCTASTDGSGIFFATRNYYLNILNNIFDHCTGAGSGALFLDTKNMYAIIDNNTFSYCNGQYGGAVGINYGHSYITIQNTLFDSCYTIITSPFSNEGRGGGLEFGNFNTNITIQNSVFRNCTSSNGGGGGIMFDSNNKRVTMQNLVFDGCKEKKIGGGAIFMQQATTQVQMSNIVIKSCFAKGAGGAMYLAIGNAAISMTNMSISNCSSASDGGGIYFMQNNEAVLIQSSVFEFNEAAGTGGAMFLRSNNSNIMLSGCTFTSNSAISGGAIGVYDSNSQFVVIDSKGAQNSKSGRLTFIGTISSEALGAAESDDDHPIVEYGIQYTNTYNVPNNTARVILTFDKRTYIIPSSETVYIYNGSKLIYKTSINNFPGIQLPALEVLRPASTIAVTYETRASTAVYGLLFYFYPVFKTKNVTTTPTVFTSNTAKIGSGGAVYLYMNNLFTVMINTMFSQNSASSDSGTGGGLYGWVGNSGLVLSSCQFISNYAGQYGGGLQLVSAHAGVEITACTMQNNIAGSSGGAIYLQTSNGAGTFSTLNKIIISNSTISSCSAPNGGAVFMDTSNVIDFVFSTLQNNSATSGGGGAIYANDGNNVRINYTTIVGNDAMYNGGAIDMIYRNVFNFNQSSVLSNTAELMGGGLYVAQDSQLIITQTVLLSNNTAGFAGGGIALTDAPLWTMARKGGKLQLSGNSAGRGSAWFVEGMTSNTSSLVNVTMSNNVAAIGGTVFWTYETGAMTSEPLGIRSVQFINNTVGYGQIATQGLTLHVPTEYTVQQYDSFLSPALLIDMTDYYNQLVTSTNETSVSVSQQDSYYNCSGRPASLTGADLNGVGVEIENGVVSFSALQAFCTPGGFSTVTFAAHLGVYAGITSNIQSLFTVQNESLFSFRDCVVGEYENNGKCITCQNGSYSLTLGATECKSCVAMIGVEACYGDQLILNQGYWRRYAHNEAVLACPLTQASCPGGYATGSTACSEGYEGPLCAVCSTGYFSSDSSCQQCTSDNEASPQLIILVLFMAAVLGIMGASFYYNYVYVDIVDLKRHIERSITDKNVVVPQLTSFHLIYLWIRKKMNEITVRLKIFTSTYQVIISTSTVFDVSMPAAFTGFTSAFQFVNLDLYSVLPVGCNGRFNFMDKLLWETLCPIIATAALGVYVLCAYFRFRYSARGPEATRQFDDAKERGLSFFFYLSYLVLPSVSVKIFQTFICTNIDPNNEDPGNDDYYLTADMSISCTSAYYYNWVIYASFMIVVYPIGIPLIYFIMLYCNKKIIQERYYVVKQGDLAVEAKVEKAVKSFSKNPLHKQFSFTPSHSFAEKKEDMQEAVVIEDKETVLPANAKTLETTTIEEESTVKTEVASGEAEEKKEEEKKEKEPATPSNPNWKPKKDQIMHRLPTHVASIAFLWAAYEPKYWYWEVIEAFRRIMLTAVLSVIAPGSSEQNVLSLILALLFIKLYSYFNPFESAVNNMMTELGQFQVFFTYLAAMALQNDLLNSEYDEGVGAVLVLINLTLPSLACYYTIKNYQADRLKAAKAAEEKRLRGEGGAESASRPSLTSYLSRASRSFSSRFSSSDGLGREGGKRMRQSAFEERAEEDFNLAVQWQTTHRASLSVSDLAASAPAEGDVEMNVFSVLHGDHGGQEEGGRFRRSSMQRDSDDESEEGEKEKK